MQMIREENARNCLQGCCDKTKKMIKTHRYVLVFENTHSYVMLNTILKAQMVPLFLSFERQFLTILSNRYLQTITLFVHCKIL